MKISGNKQMKNSFLKAAFVVVCLGGISITTPSLASTDDAAAVGLISGGGGTLAAGLALTPGAQPVAAGVAIATGGFQLGYGLACLFFDPPDVVNALTPVDINQFTSFTHPDVLTIDPTVPTALADPIDTFLDHMDQMVAYSRAYRASLDRASGADILNETLAAEERRSEANAFRSTLSKLAEESISLFENLIDDFDAFDTAILDSVVYAESIIEIRDDAEDRKLPTFEETAFEAWAVTSEEEDELFGFLSSPTNEDIENFFIGIGGDLDNGITLRDAWMASVEQVSSAHVSTPSSISLLFIGMIGLILNRTLTTNRRR